MRICKCTNRICGATPYFFSLFGREFTGCVFDVMLFRETAWRRTATFRKPLFLLAEWLQLQTSIPWCLYDFIYFCVPRLTVPVKYTLYSTCMCQAIIFFGDMFHLVRETSLFRDSAKVSLARESCARNDVNVSTMLFTVQYVPDPDWHLAGCHIILVINDL